MEKLLNQKEKENPLKKAFKSLNLIDIAFRKVRKDLKKSKKKETNDQS